MREIIPLVEKREKLGFELEKIEASIAAALADGGEIPTPFGGKRGKNQLAVTPRKRRKRSGRRGALKEKIMAELKAAGSTGVSAKALSAKLGIKNQNVHVWFSSTGRKAGVKKIAPGHYAL